MNVLVNVVLSLPLVGAFAIFALGIVVIYRASRVLNLAHGAMAMVPAYIVYTLTEAGVPVLIALVGGVVFGGVLGVATERVFIRPLRGLSATSLTVATVAVLALLIAIASRVWGTAPLRAPAIFPDKTISLGASGIRYGGIGLFVTAIVLGAGMLALFKYTDIGLAMRAAAQNPRAAGLMGVDADRTTSIAWALGGMLAAVAGAMLAAVTNLQPTTLSLLVLPAFVAALIGGLESLPGTLLGSVAVGLVFGLVPSLSSISFLAGLTSQPGAPQLVLAITAFAVMAFRGKSIVAADRDSGGLSVRGRARAGLRQTVPLPVSVIGVVLVLGWVWLPGVPFSLLANAYQAAVYAVVAVSLVLLTGWVGQISLGHAALVGIGAFTTGILVRDLGIPFPVNLPVAAAVGGIIAAALGLVALRVRGLYLAVATLIFSWMADSFLFASAKVVGSGGSSSIEAETIGHEGGFPYFDLTSRRILYFFAVSVLMICLYAAINIRDSKTGRAFFAVRGSEVAAGSLGISVMRVKVLAFAISGVLAATAGNLTIVGQRTVVPVQFAFTVSLFYLAIVVVGGLTSLRGAVLASIVFAGLNEIFFRVSALSGYLDLVSALLLTFAVLAQAPALRHYADVFARWREPYMTRPRALVSLVTNRVAVMGARIAARLAPLRARAARGPAAFWAWFTRPRGEDTGSGAAARGPAAPEPVAAVDEPDQAAALPERDETGRVVTPVLIEGRHITVRFGGLTAVGDASLQVRAGEIVGLIGPNGAGKTTLFNALSGLNSPSEGEVFLRGEDVSSKPVHERAEIGLGRTFQVLQLIGDLTVRDNLLIATHLSNPTGVIAHVLATNAAVTAERAARARVADVLERVGLTEYADRPVAGLPFGVLRMVEVARAIVGEAPVIMLDEPASGLDNAETDRLAELLLDLRAQLGVAMLLIEHDVRMVTSVSDYMYVLAQGRLIAEGVPAEVQRNPAVLAAYLGEPSADDVVEQDGAAAQAAPGELVSS